MYVVCEESWLEMEEWWVRDGKESGERCERDVREMGKSRALEGFVMGWRWFSNG